jgi:hypothetical protein
MVLSVCAYVETRDQAVVVDPLRVDDIRTGGGVDRDEILLRAISDEEPRRRCRGGKLANDIALIVIAESG